MYVKVKEPCTPPGSANAKDDLDLKGTLTLRWPWPWCPYKYQKLATAKEFGVQQSKIHKMNLTGVDFMWNRAITSFS